MNPSAKENAQPHQGTENDTLRILRHDINNQLSNILLAIEQLRYELPDASEDCIFYLNSISTSSAKISSLLNENA